MIYRKPYDDLDTSIARIAAFVRLADHLHELEPDYRHSLRESEGFLFEALGMECHRARQHFDAIWHITKAANDRRAG